MKLSNGEYKYLKEIGQWVKRHRIRANLTQTDLAKELKVSHQQIHSYESGKNQFPIVMLYRVINALGIDDTNYLFWKQIYNKNDVILCKHENNCIRSVMDMDHRSPLLTISHQR